MDFSDDPVNLYFNFDIVDETTISKLNNVYKQLTIGKLLALFYAESPFLSKSGDLDVSLKIWKSIHDNPNDIINEVEDCSETIIYTDNTIQVLTAAFNAAMQPFAVWSNTNDNATASSGFYLTKIKIILQSKLNYSIEDVYKTPLRLAIYEIISYNEMESGENIFMSDIEKRMIKERG